MCVGHPMCKWPAKKWRRCRDKIQLNLSNKPCSTLLPSKLYVHPRRSSTVTDSPGVQAQVHLRYYHDYERSGEVCVALILRRAIYSITTPSIKLMRVYWVFYAVILWLEVMFRHWQIQVVYNSLDCVAHSMLT